MQVYLSVFLNIEIIVIIICYRLLQKLFVIKKIIKTLLLWQGDDRQRQI